MFVYNLFALGILSNRFIYHRIPGRFHFYTVPGKKDYWIFRVFEYPRIPKLTLNLLIIILFFGLYTTVSIYDKLFTSTLFLNLGYLCYQVYPFTPISKKQLLKSVCTDKENCISLFIGNVYQYNRQCEDYLSNLQSADPDVVLLVETDQWWENKADVLDKTHPHQLKIPLENTYGMLLYSKLELVDGKIKYLVEDDIPSVHTCIRLLSGDLIRLYGLHPAPPVPG